MRKIMIKLMLKINYIFLKEDNQKRKGESVMIA